MDYSATSRLCAWQAPQPRGAGKQLPAPSQRALFLHVSEPLKERKEGFGFPFEVRRSSYQKKRASLSQWGVEREGPGARPPSRASTDRSSLLPPRTAPCPSAGRAAPSEAMPGS